MSDAGDRRIRPGPASASLRSVLVVVLAGLVARGSPIRGDREPDTADLVPGEIAGLTIGRVEVQGDVVDGDLQRAVVARDRAQLARHAVAGDRIGLCRNGQGWPV